MIGALLAARFIAKKPWTISALFWAIVFVLGIVAGTVIGAHLVVLLLVGFAIFLGVAWFYLKVHPVWLGIGMYIGAFIFDLIISYALGAIGIALPW